MLEIFVHQRAQLPAIAVASPPAQESVPLAPAGTAAVSEVVVGGGIIGSLIAYRLRLGPTQHFCLGGEWYSF
jgi:hypothetical protein